MTDVIFVLNAVSSEFKFARYRIQSVRADSRANDKGQTKYGLPGSLIWVFVIHAGEDRMIARHTLAVLALSPSRRPATSSKPHARNKGVQHVK